MGKGESQIQISTRQMRSRLYYSLPKRVVWLEFMHRDKQANGAEI